MSTNSILDQNLRYISVRSQWGCQPIPNSIQTIEDKEYIMAVGSRISLHEEDIGPSGSRKLLYPGPEVESIVSMEVSSDKKFIAVCVRRVIDRSKATILIYDVEAERSYPRPPRLLQYEDSTSDLFFLGSKFSQDSKYIACFTPRHYIGIIVFDWKVDKIIATIQVKSLATAVTFNPTNNTRLCVSGACGLFQFWHFTTKSTYSAPISGLNRTDISFNCHDWIGSDTVVGGTDKGQLYLIVGCETKHFLHVFGSNTDGTYVQSSISSLLIKDHLVVAYSVDGYIAICRVIKTEGRGGSIHLKLETYFLLKEMDSIFGMTWCEKRSDSMYIMVSGVDKVLSYQLPITTEPTPSGGNSSNSNMMILTPHLLHKNEINEDDIFFDDRDDIPLNNSNPPSRYITPPHSSRTTPKHNNNNNSNNNNNHNVPSLPRTLSSSDRHTYVRQTSSEISNTIKRLRIKWPYILSSRKIASYHTGMITNLSTNPRTSLLLTSSLKDSTIKVWDYNRVSDSLVLTEDFSQRPSEFPNTLDMHPAGFFFVAGTDEHVIEYAITDNKYEILRKIPIKTAVLSPTGEPIMNSSPVSIVKYSYGGHLVAVVTGRLIQIFEVYNLNYNTDKTGTPERMMILTDHISNITDITFSKDDLRLYSCAIDGAVYEWSVSRTSTGRINDYVMKGIPATHVAVSPSGKYIFATFESESIGGNNKYNKSLNRSMSRQNSEWLDENNQQTDRLDIKKSGLLVRAESGGLMSSTISGNIIGGGGGGNTNLLGRTTSNSSDNQTPAEKKSLNRSHLVMWKNGSIAPMSEEILDLPIPISSLAFGRLDGREGHEIVVLGLINGEIVISLLPIPVKVFTISPKKFNTISDVRFLSIASISTESTTVPIKKITTKRFPSTSPYDPDETDSEAGDYIGSTNSNSSTTQNNSIQLNQIIEESNNNNVSNNNNNNSVNNTNGNNNGLTQQTNSANGINNNGNNNTTTNNNNNNNNNNNSIVPISYTYDETLCRVFTLHEGAVSKVFISSSGLWIFTCGMDGCMFMLNTNLKGKDSVDVMESLCNENTILLTDKLMLKTQQMRLEDKENLLEEMLKDKKHVVHQLEIQREKEKKLLEDTMAREISKRDDIIVQGRSEIANLNKKYNEIIENLKKTHEEQLYELEVVYEKKLAHETVYIQNMKQAYDEYVTHVKFDLEAFQKKSLLKEEKLQHEKEEIIEETEKQKKLLLEYTDYIAERHKEVLKVLTDAHDEQKYRLNLELEKQTSLIDQIKYQNRQEETKTLRQMQLLKQDMQSKEMEVLNTAQELERMRDRTQRLENALQNAMAENQRKQEAAARWEFKAGEQQQQLNELERVRKALISQLHSLREEAGPKEIQIIKITEKLNELEKQYEKSLKAISEKEQHLQQNSTMVHLLHKQVRELRTSLIQKESSLKRAAKLLDEFKYSLQQARFSSRKITFPANSYDIEHNNNNNNSNGNSNNNGNNILNKTRTVSFDQSIFSNDDTNTFDSIKKNDVLSSKKNQVIELISSTPVMEESLQRLHDVLNPHSTSEDVTDDGDKLVIQEKERQIDLMRRNINSLRTNIKFNEDVAMKKVHNYLTDNEHLLYEMNQLRHEIGYLREENERLNAAIGMGNTHRQSKKALTPLQKGGNISHQPVNNQLPEFPFKRVDSDLLHSETDMGLSNISLIPEEIMVRSRGSGAPGNERPKTNNPSISNIDVGYSSNNGNETNSYKKSRSITDQDDDSVPTVNSSSLQTSSYQRADELIAELFASNQERILEENMKREANKSRLIHEANTLGSPIQQNLQSKDKKSKGVNNNSGLDVNKLDHRIGPAVRRKQDFSYTAPQADTGSDSIKLSSKSNKNKKDISGFSMTGSQLPHLTKNKK